jgi:hypothetical protein
MNEADRLTNPLGFQVTRYRRNAEIPQSFPAAPSSNFANPVVGTASRAPTNVVSGITTPSTATPVARKPGV